MKYVLDTTPDLWVVGSEYVYVEGGAHTIAYGVRFSWCAINIFTEPLGVAKKETF